MDEFISVKEFCVYDVSTFEGFFVCFLTEAADQTVFATKSVTLTS